MTESTPNRVWDINVTEHQKWLNQLKRQKACFFIFCSSTEMVFRHWSLCFHFYQMCHVCHCIYATTCSPWKADDLFCCQFFVFVLFCHTHRVIPASWRNSKKLSEMKFWRSLKVHIVSVFSIFDCPLKATLCRFLGKQLCYSLLSSFLPPYVLSSLWSLCHYQHKGTSELASFLPPGKKC